LSGAVRRNIATGGNYERFRPDSCFDTAPPAVCAWSFPDAEVSRRPLFTNRQRFLLVSSFLIALGGFAVLPYMSVVLHQLLGMSLGAVGVVLGVASLLQFAGSLVGAAVAERIGLQRTMLLALVIRTAGFAGFIVALRWPGAAIAALVLTASGAALCLPANKAYLLLGVDMRLRPRLLSASNSAINAGIALGPLAPSKSTFWRGRAEDPAQAVCSPVAAGSEVEMRSVPLTTSLATSVSRRLCVRA
jgi:MFS family permease